MMPNIAPAAAALARRAQRLSVASAAFIVVLGLLWELWLAPTGRGTLALKVLPLAGLLPGLARGDLRIYGWASLCVWAYAAEGATRLATEAPRAASLAALELAASLLLFCALVLHIRSRRNVSARGARP